jgi:subtilisin family serine protease
VLLLARPSRSIGVASFILTAALAIGLAPAAANPIVPEPNDALPVPGHYVVTLASKPIATYAGGIEGLAATRPTKNRGVDTASTAARRYRSYLSKLQINAAARVGVRPQRQFSVASNAFTASLTPAQAQALRRAPGVLAVTKDVPRKLLDDTNSQDFLRLTGPNGVWKSLGGAGLAGRGVVVGMLDSGIWPESKSFAGAALGTKKPTAADPFRPYRSKGKIIMHKADGKDFKGVCQTGPRWPAGTCNTKIIGARFFNAEWKSFIPPGQRFDVNSPRDIDGHGTHTASTAAGNAGVTAVINGNSYGKISGVAPAAKIAVYKVGWKDVSAPDAGFTYTSDAIDAIDAAVADGVDVLSYSISGSDSPVDPVDLAFLSAASAGIFVSVAAGNEGPSAGTLNHVTPWLTTVAASTLKPQQGTVRLGNGTSYVGPSLTIPPAGVGPKQLVLASSVKLASASAADAMLCLPDTLDPARAARKVVFCDRGDAQLDEKALEVKHAGGAAIIIGNVAGDATTVFALDFAVPGIHLALAEAQPVRAYAATSGATVTLKRGNLIGAPANPYPQVADFSSRGPSLGNAGDLLKPDIAAPGVAVLASYSKGSFGSIQGRNFAFLDGTSMATPHIAGAAALYLGKHPHWSPMAIKSAMMTTATRLRTANGRVSNDYFAQGAGNIRPDRMFDPGVVFKSSERDWLAYLESQGVDTGYGVSPIDPSDFNAPSIAVGKLVGTQVVTRRVTAVKAGLYQTSINLPGVGATVSPSLLYFSRAGQTRTLKITFSQRTAPLSEADFGSLRIAGRGTIARVPIVVVPEAVDAPDFITGTGTSGSTSFSVKPGFSGSFPVTAAGLATATPQPGEVAEGGDPKDFDQAIPSGTRVARFAVASDDPAADIDLEVYQLVEGVLSLVGASDSPTGIETVTLVDPEPGNYVVRVLPFTDPPGSSSTTFTLRNFVVGPNLGNFTVTPANATVTTNTPITLTASWSGLASSTRYLGFIGYVDGSGTVVRIN